MSTSSMKDIKTMIFLKLFVWLVIDYKLDLIGKKQLENNIASHKAKKVFASGTKNKNGCGK